MTLANTESRRERYRTTLAVFLAGLLVGTLADDFLRNADAQIPDPALQRNQTALAIDRTNDLLTQVIGILKKDTLKVEVVKADKRNGDGLRGPGRSSDTGSRPTPVVDPAGSGALPGD
jgi:hypothetical protein